MLYSNKGRKRGQHWEHFDDIYVDANFKSKRCKCKYCGNSISITSHNMKTHINNCTLAQKSLSQLSTPVSGEKSITMHSGSPNPLALMTEGEKTKDEYTTLVSFLCKESEEGNIPMDLVQTLIHIQSATKQLASLISKLGIAELTGAYDASENALSDKRDKPKKLDVVANEIMISSLKNSHQVGVIASEEEDDPVFLSSKKKYVVVFDPLDGSRNIDANIPTGTIFGIYEMLPDDKNLNNEEKAKLNVLQPGSKQVASGYCLYSSATILVITFGKGVYGFTLDSSIGEYVLTHSKLQIPKRGQIYSLNDARYYDWPDGLKRYIDDIRQGKGQSKKKYSARYICCLVADFHRTLLYGGIAMNPRDHLRLVYEANPLSFIAKQAGGSGTDGLKDILDIQPTEMHQRLPLFLGSPDDISELKSYENVQQLVNPGYEV